MDGEYFEMKISNVNLAETAAIADKINADWELGGQEMTATLATPGNAGTLSIKIHPRFFDDNEFGDTEDAVKFAMMCCRCVEEIVSGHRDELCPVPCITWNEATAINLASCPRPAHRSMKDLMRRELVLWIELRRAEQRLAVASILA